jgi:predicted dehydrogenase
MEDLMAEVIRIGVIGVGQIGKRHLGRYAQIEGAQIVAIADIDQAEAHRVSQQYGISEVYTDFRDLLARDDIEAVDVCLHNNFHMPVTVAALEAGKHVYCEKPMAGAYIDAEKMYRTAQERDLELAIQLNTLFQEETKAAKWLIDNEHLGKLYHARSTGFRRRGRPYVDGYGSSSFVQKRTSGGGAMYDMGVYHIARMLYLLGNPHVLRVTGKTYQEVEMDAARREASGYDVEELGLGFVRLEHDITLDIIEAWSALLDAFEGSSILGSQGGVRLDPFGFFHSLGHLDMNATADLERFMFRVHNVQGVGDEYDSAQHHWIAALQGRVELLPTAELALNTMLISEGIYLSERLGREADAEEIRASSVSTAVKL